MQLAIFFFVLLNAIYSQRVKRQWGPSDFYQFEQWVNYVNRPRDREYSADPHWGMTQYSTGNRNIQPHSAPNGWHLEQNPYWMNGYRQMASFPQLRSRPPVVIETNVYRTNSRIPVPFSPSNGYGVPPQLMGTRGFQPHTTSTTTTTTTTSAATTTTTEDEAERFIQTAVKEDIDNVSLVSLTTEEVLTTTGSTTITARTTTTNPSTTNTTSKTATTASTTSVTTTAAPTTTLTTKATTESITTETATTPTSTTTTISEEPVDFEANMNTRVTTLENTSATEFHSPDYNSVWTEGEPSTTFVVSVGPTTTEKADLTTETPSTILSRTQSSRTESTIDIFSTQTDTTEAPSTSIMSLIPEAEAFSETEAFVTGEPTLTTTEPPLSDLVTDSQADLGMRPPPLPIDILRRFRELGMSIEPTL